MKYWADLYRGAGEEFGTSDKLEVNLLRDGWVADSLDEVEKVWWPCIRSEHWFYFEQVPRWVAEREPFLEGISKEDDFKFDRHRIDRLIVGSPEDCIESIRKFQDAIDLELHDHVVPRRRRPELRAGARMHPAVRGRGDPRVQIGAGCVDRLTRGQVSMAPPSASITAPVRKPLVMHMRKTSASSGG